MASGDRRIGRQAGVVRDAASECGDVSGGPGRVLAFLRREFRAVRGPLRFPCGQFFCVWALGWGRTRCGGPRELVEPKAVEKSGGGGGGFSCRWDGSWMSMRGGRRSCWARAAGRDKDEAGEFQTLLTISADAGTKIDGAGAAARVGEGFCEL